MTSRESTYKMATTRCNEEDHEDTRPCRACIDYIGRLEVSAAERAAYERGFEEARKRASEAADRCAKDWKTRVRHQGTPISSASSVGAEMLAEVIRALRPHEDAGREGEENHGDIRESYEDGRAAEINRVGGIKHLERQLSAAEKVVEAARLDRNTIIREGYPKSFKGDWIALPLSDFWELREALSAYDRVRRGTSSGSPVGR